MGFLDKVKNMFIEEIEEDEEPVKKEVIQVEIPSPKVEEPKETEVIEKVVEKREEKFVFPVYFDDNDFEKIEKKEEVKQVQRQEQPVKIVEKPPVREVYGIKKEEKVEKKNFTPTPIISPVYGVLDKNYRKEEIKTKKRVSSYEYRSNEKVDIDDVRNKAYGTLENDLEDNLFKKTSILFNDEVEEQDVPIDIFEEPRHGKDTLETEDFEDNMTLEELNREYEEYKQKSSYVDELNDSDLFNLIDSMYEKGND